MKCYDPDELLDIFEFNNQSQLSRDEFSQLGMPLIWMRLNEECHEHHEHPENNKNKKKCVSARDSNMLLLIYSSNGLLFSVI
jgi:hypothetical protein